MKYTEGPRFSSFQEARIHLPTLSKRVWLEVGGLTRARFIFLRETVGADLHFDFNTATTQNADTTRLIGKMLLELVGDKESGKVWFTNCDYNFAFHHFKYLLMLDGGFRQGIFEEVKDGDGYAYVLAGLGEPELPVVRTQFVITPTPRFQALIYLHDGAR